MPPLKSAQAGTFAIIGISHFFEPGMLRLGILLLSVMLFGWEVKNSQRLDVVQDPTPGQKPANGWSVVTGEALPIEERSQIRINSDSQSLDGGFGGSTEYEGTVYLLPYYFGLYHGFLK